MIFTNTLGNISLNISFVLYLVVYLPQIRHNQTSKHLEQLNLNLHFILILSFMLDLMYGVLKPLPWQYQAVSVVGLILLTIQHLQLIHFYQLKKRHMLSLTLICLCGLLAGFFLFKDSLRAPLVILSIGYLSRLGFLTYTLPQIIQNYRRKSASALSLTFLKLSLFLSILDLISAWCLSWGWPNQLGTPIMLILTLTLLWQKAHYRDALTTSQPTAPPHLKKVIFF